MENFEQTTQVETAQEPVQVQEPTQQAEMTNVDSQTDSDNDTILGKFKSIDDLANAYKNIQSQHGQQSKELGELRKKAEILDKMQQQQIESNENFKKAKDYFSQVVPKYDKDEYFKNSDFNDLYKEAFKALGTNLDTDKFVSLVDKYVSSRITQYEKSQAAKSETENAKSHMQFSKSSKANKASLPKFESIPDNKMDEVLAKYI